MSLKERIKNDLKEAMRNKEVLKRDTLRNIQAAIKQIEVDKRIELDDGAIEEIMAKYLKQREDAKGQFLDAGREDLVAKEQAEIDIISSYLPEPLTQEELESITKELIATLGASGMKDMGKVMGALKEKVGARADGNAMSSVVKSLLS